MKRLSLTTLTFLTFSSLLLNAEAIKIDMHGGKEHKLESTLPSSTQQEQKAPIFYGKVLEIKPAMGYKYLKIQEQGKQIWVAIANAPIKVGDKIGFDKKTMMKDFKSKSLNQTFKEIYFASDIYLPQKASGPKSMKDMLGLGTKANDPHASIGGIGMSAAPKEETPSKPFVKKDTYTVEEIHMWRKELKDQIITLEGTVFKVSHGIMKRDWVHLGDGSGKEKKLTDDLVFTAAHTTIKAGDNVLAKGKVVIDKDFGYGYFYKVIIEDAHFEVK
jgi:predicted heme/steroid binding protein